MPLFHGNSACWTSDEFGTFDYKRCCPQPKELGIVATDYGCQHVYYRHYRSVTSHYYRTNQSLPDLVVMYSKMIRNFEVVVDECPPAAMITALLKFEEGVWFDKSEHMWQDAVLSLWRRLRPDSRNLAWQKEWASWSIEPAKWRVRQMRNVFERNIASPTATRKNVDLVIVICNRSEEPFWLAAVTNPRVGISAGVSLAELARERMSLRFYMKCGDARFHAEFGAELAARWGPHFRDVTWVEVFDDVRADDCSGYMAHLAWEYGALADYTMFLHADAPDHVPDVQGITLPLFLAANGFLDERLNYLHISLNYVLHDDQTDTRDDLSDWRNMWRGLFKSSVAPPIGGAGGVVTYCCVQFLVKREAVLRRPRSFYLDGLQVVNCSIFQI